jgi:murein DD-endopeptidase
MFPQTTKIHRTLLSLLVSLIVLPGCGAGPSRPVAERAAIAEIPGTTGLTAAEVALEQVGVPYRYGGSDRDGFDCSGLVFYAYSRAGKTLPRTTGELWRRSIPVPDRELRTGDLLFFNIEGKMSHVGMYLGDGSFVHAPSTGKRVSVASLESAFYRQAFIRGGRF